MSQSVTRLEDYDTEPSYTATVVSTSRITAEESSDEVRELLLDVADSGVQFQVGQHIGVIAPGSSEFGHAQHFRLYSIADLPERTDGGHARIKICVKRCSYIDRYSGEKYRGIASHYLCDLRAGATISISGPFGSPFVVPERRDANLILIGSGTGIAPFRAFVKHLYSDVTDWNGRVLLFHGAKSGLELLYMNDRDDDFAQYYDKETFEAFKVLSPRPNWSDPIAWDQAIMERAGEIWEMLLDAKTYVYLAGPEKMRDQLDTVFTNVGGGEDRWRRMKAELLAAGRWVELLY